MSNEPTPYNFQGGPQANSQWSGALNAGGNALSNIQSNPYFGNALQGAQGLQQAGQNQYGQLMNMANANQGYGNQIMQQAFDPQGALYARMQQQQQDQSNAQMAATGLANSPYAAGLTNQANQNFNINWQNQQLGRETQGAQAYDQLQSQSAADMGQGLSALSSTFDAPYREYLGEQDATLGAAQGVSNMDSSFMNALLGFQNSASQIDQGAFGQLMGLFGLGGNVVNNVGQWAQGSFGGDYPGF